MSETVVFNSGWVMHNALQKYPFDCYCISETLIHASQYTYSQLLADLIHYGYEIPLIPGSPHYTKIIENIELKLKVDVDVECMTALLGAMEEVIYSQLGSTAYFIDVVAIVPPIVWCKAW